MSSDRNATSSLPVVSRSHSAQEIASLSDHAGAVIIRGFMTPEQVTRINHELDAPLAALDAGSKHEHQLVTDNSGEPGLGQLRGCWIARDDHSCGTEGR